MTALFILAAALVSLAHADAGAQAHPRAGAFAQTQDNVRIRTQTDAAALRDLSRRHLEWLSAHRPKRYHEMLQSSAAPQVYLNASSRVRLFYMDETGFPVFRTLFNLNAARTIGTDDVWPGGSGELELDGSSTKPGELGIWDGGSVDEYHIELQGRVTAIDGYHYPGPHATHVAGTMIAAGVDPRAKGMSFAAVLASYDIEEDISEMALAATQGMLVSNHSYGTLAGWDYIVVGDFAEPAWLGNASISPTEDYKFGYYDETARDLDQLAYDAPFYSTVVAAGNDRDDGPSEPGAGHWEWNGLDWEWSTQVRDPDGGAEGYDCLPSSGTAKNIITVGAVGDIPNGYTGPSDVVMSAFSSWGPCDDGRIKPDVVANGIDLYSCSSYGINQYATMSGTSMAAPCVSGSINLLVQHFEATHGGETPRAATVKALIVQTAGEAGPHAGPDYMFGWGLMNTLGAARLIERDAAYPGYVIEEVLREGDTHRYYLYSGGVEPLRVTCAWTDPPASPPAPSLDPVDPMLVSDVDIRLEHAGTAAVYMPYVLDPAHPSEAAAAGDNARDNVEQIHIAHPPAGHYVLTVSHKGALHGGSQAYSLTCSSRACTQFCGQPVLLAAEHRQLSWNDPLWKIQVRLVNNGPGTARGVTVSARVHENGVVIADSSCNYGDIPENGSSYGRIDSYTFDMADYTGERFTVTFDASYVDACDNPYRVSLDVQFDPASDLHENLLRLYQNYPNPFTSQTTIPYETPAGRRSSIRIYDVTGRIVRTLVEKSAGDGFREVDWDGRDDGGAVVSAGVYFCRLESGRAVRMKRMILLR